MTFSSPNPGLTMCKAGRFPATGQCSIQGRRKREDISKHASNHVGYRLMYNVGHGSRIVQRATRKQQKQHACSCLKHRPHLLTFQPNVSGHLLRISAHLHLHSEPASVSLAYIAHTPFSWYTHAALLRQATKHTPQNCTYQQHESPTYPCGRT